MLFNSAEFIFAFFPLCLFLFFYSAKKWGNEAAIFVLVCASLFFYGWWNPSYLVLLISSMVFNYHAGKFIGKNPIKQILLICVFINLAAIAYFKYAGFLILNFNALTGSEYNLGTILLPLAISFFTFQQIAYLVDSYKGITKEYSFLHYSLFVSFFPQLIAGPIVHHKDMLPQFSQVERYKLNINHINIGLSIFALGLFKKTVLADGVAEYASPVFFLADNGEDIDFFMAWGASLAYSFQLYFDFSGYSDMAIGLARMFGIILPLNFYSPYKATNIAEFWRRWHITLSSFLRDYIYIPLGGNRKGNLKRYSNLFITMLLGGIWHGAGWNFIIWGILHGSYLMINLYWQTLKATLNIAVQNKLYTLFAWLITFIAVLVGWVFFRATTFEGAINILHGMCGLNGFEMPNAILSRLGSLGTQLQLMGISPSNGGAVFISMWAWNIFLLIFVLIMPNIQDLFSKYITRSGSFNYENNNTFWPLYKAVNGTYWAENYKWALIAGSALAFGLLTLSQVSEFLYFQF